MILRAFPIALLLITSAPISAEVAIAARNIRPCEVISVTDVMVIRGEASGAFKSADLIVGAEAKVALYAGRPIRRGDVRPPALIGRNDLVELVYRTRGLEIVAAGRSLARGGVGEKITVLNTSSRRRVLGQVLPNGRVLVE